MYRVILILLAVPVLLLVAAVLVIPLVLDERELLDLAAERLKRETGATLSVDGAVNLSLFPGISVDLSDTRIIVPGEQAMSIQARFLGIGLEIMPLLFGRVEIDEIAVEGLMVTLQSAPEQPALDTSTLTDQELDAYYARRRQELAEAGQVAGQEAIVAAPLALNVNRLLVSDSVLETVSAETGERSRVEIISLEATDLNLEGRAIPLTMEVRLIGGEDSPALDVAVEGRVRVNASKQLLALDDLALEVTGALAEPIRVQTRGELDLVKQAADLQVELEFGDTRGQGKLRFASFESPQISANLHLNVLAPALLALAGPDAGAASNAAADGGAGHPGAGHPGAISNDDSPGPDPGAEQALPLNAIRAMDTRVVLSIDRAIFAGHVVKKLQVKLRAVDGIVKINSLTGKLHGGELAMTATFNAQHNTARLNTKGGLIGMDIAKALKAVYAEPVMSGKADLDWRLGSRGTTSAQLLEAMKGPIKLAGRGVTLHQLGIEKLLCEAVALANGESLAKVLPDSTRFKTLSADLKMNRGELQMKPLRAELSQVKLTGEGALDLLKQDFSVTFTARLSPGLAELDPACRVNERITAIGWPVNCEGSITGDPAGWCSVDSQQIIEDLATGEVQRKLEKEAGKFLDKFLN